MRQQMTVFVGGAIQFAIGANGIFNKRLREIQEVVLASLEVDGVRLLSAHRFESFGEMDTTGREMEVCTRDFQWMNQCDAFVAVLPSEPDGIPIRTDGTCVELGWAVALGKPIIVVWSAGNSYSHLIAGLGAVAAVQYLEVEHVMAQPSILLEAALSAVKN